MARAGGSDGLPRGFRLTPELIDQKSVLRRELHRARRRNRGVGAEERRQDVLSRGRPLGDVEQVERLHGQAHAVPAELEPLLQRRVRVEVLRVVGEAGDRGLPEIGAQGVGLFGGQLADRVARIVEAGAGGHAGSGDAHRLVHPVAGEAVAVEVAAGGDDVERRFAAVLDDQAELYAEGDVDLAVCRDPVTPVLGVGTEAEIGLGRDLEAAHEVERVVLGLRQRVGDAPLVAVAEPLLQVDEQTLVADLAVVVVEVLGSEVGIGPAADRDAAGRIGGAGHCRIRVGDADVVVAAVVDEADIQADVARQFPAVADLAVPVPRRDQRRIDDRHGRRRVADRAAVERIRPRQR